MDNFEASASLEDMVAEEKRTTAEDQLNLFAAATKVSELFSKVFVFNEICIVGGGGKEDRRRSF